MARKTISAFIVCSNEERQIARCINSVKWCDEIICIIDSKSKDNTEKIALLLNAKVYFKEWQGYVEQKRFGLEKCNSDWVLNLDADEEVSGELRDEIIDVLERDLLTINGYHISRVVYFLNRWWRHGGWYPEYRLRLCRRSHTTWGGDNPHEKAIVTGNTKKLTGELYHYTYTDLSDQVSRINGYARSAAKTLWDKGVQSNLAIFKGMLLHPIARFLKFYLFKMGFRDGTAGFIIAISETYYVFLKYAKLWEIRMNQLNTKKE